MTSVIVFLEFRISSKRIIGKYVYPLSGGELDEKIYLICLICTKTCKNDKYFVELVTSWSLHWLPGNCSRENISTCNSPSNSELLFL